MQEILKNDSGPIYNEEGGQLHSEYPVRDEKEEGGESWEMWCFYKRMCQRSESCGRNMSNTTHSCEQSNSFIMLKVIKCLLPSFHRKCLEHNAYVRAIELVHRVKCHQGFTAVTSSWIIGTQRMYASNWICSSCQTSSSIYCQHFIVLSSTPCTQRLLFSILLVLLFLHLCLILSFGLYHI